MRLASPPSGLCWYHPRVILCYSTTAEKRHQLPIMPQCVFVELRDKALEDTDWSCARHCASSSYCQAQYQLLFLQLVGVVLTYEGYRYGFYCGTCVFHKFAPHGDHPPHCPRTVPRVHVQHCFRREKCLTLQYRLLK